MHERRSQLRGYTNDYLVVIDRNTEEIIGRVCNLCLDGMMVISKMAVDVSDTFECRMALPEPHLDRNQMLFGAEVVWRRDTEVEGTMRIGLRFTDIDATGRKIIVKLLETCTVAAASPADAKNLSV
jgi:c-di-GMP-binding flagellar brake protein YcgR